MQVGDQAPVFSLAGSDGNTHQLGGRSDKITVVYFYPKDMTLGCTTEACDFNERLGELTQQQVCIYGVSPDPMISHERFRDKHHLRFELLCDPDKTVHKAYNAWGEKVLYGKRSTGVIRSTFILDRQGIISHMWRHVRVKDHAQKVLQAIVAKNSDGSAT